MSSYQKLILVGYLGKDPETRYTPSGTAITTFSVATSEKWKDKNSGEQQERTTWHYCECWGRQAEVAGEYLNKGSQVLVEGKIRQEEWEKDGETQRMTKVRVDNLQFMSTRGDNKPRQQAAATAGASNAAPDDNLDSDIPF